MNTVQYGGSSGVTISSNYVGLQNVHAGGTITASTTTTPTQFFYEDMQFYGVSNGRVHRVEPKAGVVVTVHGEYTHTDLGPVEEFEYGIDEDEDD